MAIDDTDYSHLTDQNRSQRKTRRIVAPTSRRIFSQQVACAHASGKHAQLAEIRRGIDRAKCEAQAFQDRLAPEHHRITTLQEATSQMPWVARLLDRAQYSLSRPQSEATVRPAEPEQVSAATDPHPAIKRAGKPWRGIVTPEGHVVLLKVDVGLAMAAIQHGHECGYAVWLLARLCDSAGRGRIDLSTLRARAKECGLAGQRWRRWFANALEAGFLVKWADDSVRLRGLEKSGAAYGLTSIGSVPVFISPLVLSNVSKLRAELFAAWHEGHNKKTPGPISRETIAEVTGISGRTQYEYERRARVRVIHNLAVDESISIPAPAGPAWLAAQKEFQDRPVTFLVGDAKRKGILHPAYPLPNQYRTRLDRAPRGMRRQVNRRLRHQVSLLEQGAAGFVTRGHNRRIFFDSQMAARVSIEHRETQVGRGMPAALELADPRREVFHRRRDKTRGGRVVYRPLPRTPSPDSRREGCNADAGGGGRPR